MLADVFMHSSKIRVVVWICANGCGILSVCKKRSATAAERRAFMEKTINQPKKAALYCRLSVDDGRSGESISIESQKILLRQYCKSHGITDYEVYDDDGYSGTNFERPAFERMREDIDNGRIHTVIVKDQSRFGRSYIEVGMYVEEFKDKGVRFIAVDDGYDSMKSDYDMMFPMRNVINEYYAREASKKTKSAKRAKAKEGQYIGSRPPFGYKLDPKDRHHLVIDEPAAETVRRILLLDVQNARQGILRLALHHIRCAVSACVLRLAENDRLLCKGHNRVQKVPAKQMQKQLTQTARKHCKRSRAKADKTKRDR